MIRLVTGKSKSGKTTRLFEEMSHYKIESSSNKAILIVPEQFTLEAEKKYIEHLGGQGFIGTEILSFKRLCHKVILENQADDRIMIGEIGRMMLLQKTFKNHENELKFYKNAYNKHGFLKRFNELIQELRQNRIDLPMFDQISERLEPESVLGMKLRDINVVYRNYMDQKESLFFDDEDAYELFLELAESSQMIRHAEIWMDGFDSFSNQEYEVIRMLARYSNKLTIALTVRDEEIFSHTQLAVQKLQNIANEEKKALEIERLDSSFLNEYLSHFALNLMAYPYERLSEKTDRIHIHAANSRLSEVEHCALKIVDAVRDEGYAWRDIAVVTNDIAAYESVVKRIFENYKLPYFLDIKQGVLSNPFVRYVLGMVHISMQPSQIMHVIQLMKTGYLEFESRDVDLFEIYVKTNGFKTWQLKAPFHLEMEHGLPLDRLNDIREKLNQIIDPLIVSGKISCEAYVRILYDHLVNESVHDKIEQQVQEFATMNLMDDAQLFSQIWNKTMGLFDQMVAILGNEKLSLEEIGQFIETGFEHMEVGVLPLNENQIMIGSLDRSKAHDIKLLFILGVNDGILPETGSDQPLITDLEKEVLNANRVQILADSKMFLDKETFNIYSAISRPSDRLVLSYAKSDAEGSALRESYLISKSKKILTDVVASSDRVYDTSDNNGIPACISVQSSTWDHLAFETRRYVDGIKMNDGWFQTLTWYANVDRDRVDKLLNAVDYSNHVDRLNRNQLEKLYDLPIKSSVSRLEEFVECPFKYFVSTGLAPYIPKSFLLEYPDVGILLHKTLELFGKELHNRNLDWTALDLEDQDRLIGGIVDSMVDNDLFQSKYQYRYMIYKLKRVARRSVSTLTKHLNIGRFKPTAFELVFTDSGKGVPPIVIPLDDNNKILLRGVIDRVDLFEDDDKTYVKIIDYKSGSRHLTLSDIYNGLQMQLMVYLEACLSHPEYFKKDQLFPAGAFYYKIDDPMIESVDQGRDHIEQEIIETLKLDGIVLQDMEVLKGFDVNLPDDKKSSVINVRLKVDGDFTKDSKTIEMEDFNHLIQWVSSKIKDIGSELLNGNVSINPCKSSTFTSCDYCKYKALCQFDPKFSGNSYRRIENYSNDEVIEKIGSGGAHGKLDS